MRASGLEPETSSLSGTRSNQLSYARADSRYRRLPSNLSPSRCRALGRRQTLAFYEYSVWCQIGRSVINKPPFATSPGRDRGSCAAAGRLPVVFQSVNGLAANASDRCAAARSSRRVALQPSACGLEAGRARGQSDLPRSEIHTKGGRVAHPAISVQSEKLIQTGHVMGEPDRNRRRDLPVYPNHCPDTSQGAEVP